MKKLNRLFLKSTSRLAGVILSLLGFSLTGCDTEKPDMYGTPYATHTIKGKVMDEAAKAMPEIQVEVIRNIEYAPDTTFLETDAKGEFSYEDNHAMINGEYELIINSQPDKTDIAYESDTLRIDFENATYKNAKGWYHGEASKEVSVQLTKKKDE